MANFNRLQSQVEDGTLRLIHVEAVPRSVSTALSRALNESGEPSVYVNEPFNRRRYDIEEASGNILAATDPITRTSDRRVTVIAKNMARNLSLGLFRDWMEVTDGVVWSVRDPLIQMGSLVTRIANDLAYEPGADQIGQEDLTPKDIQAASDFLENGAVSSGFSKTSWADIGEHFRSGYQPEKSVVVDGGNLTVDPTTVLHGIARRVGLVFDDRMVDGWQSDFVNANTGYTRDDSPMAWTRHAVTSDSITAIFRPALEVTQLPPALRAHLTDIAIPTYQEMMATAGL